MRIALIAHSNAPWTPHYARFFSTAGHAVCVISFHPQVLEGIETRYVGSVPYREDHGRSLFIRRAPVVRRFLRAWAPDVVLAPYLISNGLTAAIAGAAPLVVSARGGDVLAQSGGTPMPALLRRVLVRFVCGRSRRVHAVSEELVEEMVIMGVSPEKIDCFPVGVDLGRFPMKPRAPAAGHEPLLICTRRHEPVYRNQDIVGALADLMRRGRRARCLFVGGGALLEPLRRQVAALGLQGQVEFTEQLDHRKVPSLLQQADVYVSASSSDGTSSSLLEAMASGIFPVVSRIRANEAWLHDGESGLLFRTGDVSDLVSCLERAFDDLSLRMRAAEINRETVERRADLEVNNRRLLALLEDVVARQGRC